MSSKKLPSRIRAAMKKNERDLLRVIRIYNKRGEFWYPRLMKNSWWNALDRLEEKKQVKFSRRGGYFVVGLDSRWML